MKLIFRFVITTYFMVTCSGFALAEAPVVDSNENFALLDQQAAQVSSVASRDIQDVSYDDTQPLARDTTDLASDHENADLINKLHGLQQEIQELRGQLEVQTHDLKVLQEQQLSFYNDLDARISGRQPIKSAKNQAEPLNLDEQTSAMQHVAAEPQQVAPAANQSDNLSSAAPATSATTAMIATTTNANPADEQISYLKAYELVKTKQYDDALIAMQHFTQKYPKGGYTANAEYWLGELYLVKQNYADAITHFSTVLQQFPSSSKYSASLLKIGYALADAGRIAEAKERFHEVMKKYPDTSTANLARLKLETLGG